MKPRKVVITIEVESGLKIKELKETYSVDVFGVKVKQIQVNVIQDKK